MWRYPVFRCFESPFVVCETISYHRIKVALRHRLGLCSTVGIVIWCGGILEWCLERHRPYAFLWVKLSLTLNLKIGKYNIRLRLCDHRFLPLKQCFPPTVGIYFQLWKHDRTPSKNPVKRLNTSMFQTHSNTKKMISDHKLQTLNLHFLKFA